MAVCVVLIVRTVQKRTRQRRAMELGLDMDERRFKRRLEAAVAEVDDIFADDDDDVLEDEGLTGAEREQLKLLEAEASKTPSRGAAATPAPASVKKAGAKDIESGNSQAPATPKR